MSNYQGKELIMDEQVIEHHGPARAPQDGAPVRALATAVAASPLDLPAEVFRAGLDRRRENRAALMDWVRAALVENVDFGRIHVVSKDKCRAGRNCKNPTHFSKPSLFKPGAEKICGMLGVTVHYPTLHDYEQAALHGVQLVHVIVRCELHDVAGRVIADGVGARSLKQDYGDINKALKMAEKSAHIDATLRMAGLSEVFTQDVEDMAHGKDVEKAPANAPGDQAQDGTQGGASAQSQERAARITDAQHRRLEARIAQLGLDRERVKDWMRRATANRPGGPIEHFKHLTPAIYEKLDAKLEAWAEREAIQHEGVA